MGPRLKILVMNNVRILVNASFHLKYLLCFPDQCITSKRILDCNRSQILCQAGKYQDLSEQESCKDCAAGKVLEKNYYDSSLDASLLRIGSSWSDYVGPLKDYDQMYDYSGVHGLADRDPIDGYFIAGYSPNFEYLRNQQQNAHNAASDCVDCPTGRYKNKPNVLHVISNAGYGCGTNYYCYQTANTLTSNWYDCPTVGKKILVYKTDGELRTYNCYAWNGGLFSNNSGFFDNMYKIPHKVCFCFSSKLHTFH